MANLINLENVSKTWGLKTLLDGVSLGVQTVSYTHLTLPTKRIV